MLQWDSFSSVRNWFVNIKTIHLSVYFDNPLTLALVLVPAHQLRTSH